MLIKNVKTKPKKKIFVSLHVFRQGRDSVFFVVWIPHCTKLKDYAFPFFDLVLLWTTTCIWTNHWRPLQPLVATPWTDKLKYLWLVVPLPIPPICTYPAYMPFKGTSICLLWSAHIIIKSTGFNISPEI